MAVIEKIVVDGKEVDGKECTKCKLLKPINHFGIAKRSLDGHRSWCKQCEREKRYGYAAVYNWANCHERK